MKVMERSVHNNKGYYFCFFNAFLLNVSVSTSASLSSPLLLVIHLLFPLPVMLEKDHLKVIVTSRASAS